MRCDAAPRPILAKREDRQMATHVPPSPSVPTADSRSHSRRAISAFSPLLPALETRLE
jgi:hypothetical protein